MLKEQPWYRREAFVAGLERSGYQAALRAPSGPPARGDVLVIWNRYGDRDHIATRFEAAGGVVLVAENGYIDPTRHGARSWYAIARGGHNGQGWWPSGSGRWDEIAPRLGADWKPWRLSGEHVLVCPNRSFGRPGFVMPPSWAADVALRLRELTRRPVRIRPHPGNDKPAVPLAADLADCWAVVVWASSAGVHALLAGVPVICQAPAWILKRCCPARMEDVNLTQVGDRAPAFERLAWAQWHVDEIASGEPFRRLLGNE